MKKLKNRLKRSLFEFFKDQILNCVDHRKFVEIEYKSVDLDFVRLESSISFNPSDISNFNGYHAPAHVFYERELSEAKKQLFDAAMQHVYVREESVVNQHVFDQREIRLTLFVAKRKTPY